MHATLATADNLPASHAIHVSLIDAPRVLEYLPAEQATHAASLIAPAEVRYFPAPHSVHTMLPVASLNFPAEHFVHVPPSGHHAPALHVQLVETELPKGQLESVGHVEHVDSVVAPSTAENLPAAQSLQVLAPASALYLPAAQLVHAGPEPVKPLLHMQAVEAELPAGETELVVHSEQVFSEVAPIACEYLDAPQSEHVSVPANALYCPVTHSVHVPPSGPEEPALHLQAPVLLLPAGAMEFGGHERQFVDADAVEYLPCSQFVQESAELCPTYGENFPATQF